MEPKYLISPLLLPTPGPMLQPITTETSNSEEIGSFLPLNRNWASACRVEPNEKVNIFVWCPLYSQ